MYTYCVAILTCDRSALLQQLLVSLEGQTYPKENFDVLIVNNNPSTVIQKSDIEQYQLNIIIINEPQKGIPFARNAVLRFIRHADKYNYLVFVDDDEEVPNSWLNNLTEAHTKYNADIIQGPAIPKFEKKPVAPPIFYSKWRKEDKDFQVNIASSNNVSIHTALIKESDLLFDVSYVLSGGSDTDFFKNLIFEKKPKIFWVSNCAVSENIPIKRTTLAWITKRYLRYGNNVPHVLKKMHTPPMLFLACLRYLIDRLLLSFFKPLNFREYFWNIYLNYVFSIGLILGMLNIRVKEYIN